MERKVREGRWKGKSGEVKKLGRAVPL